MHSFSKLCACELQSRNSASSEKHINASADLSREGLSIQDSRKCIVYHIVTENYLWFGLMNNHSHH